MHVLKVEGLGKVYRLGQKKRDLWALRNVSFDVEPGTILGIIGPNGAGKTTLLKVLSRISPPSEGRVIGRGRVVPLLAIGSGFQADLTGRENILLNAAMYGIPKADVEARIPQIVEFADFGDFLDIPMKRYSSGMFLRLAFSVAINMEPDILLADEVLAVGDAEFQERCLERVRQAGQAGMAVLFVSHDMEAIRRLCDRVLWLNHGEIVRLGEPAGIVEEYQNSAMTLAYQKLQSGQKKNYTCEWGEIVAVNLVSEADQPIGAVKTTDTVLMKISFRISEPGVRVMCALHFNVRGIPVFRAHAFEWQAIDAPGDYVAVARVPRHLLAATRYAVHADVVIAKPEKRYGLTALNALSFEVFDPSSWSKDHIRGLVAPHLEWRFEAQGGGAAPPRPSDPPRVGEPVAR